MKSGQDEPECEPEPQDQAAVHYQADSEYCTVDLMKSNVQQIPDADSGSNHSPVSTEWPQPPTFQNINGDNETRSQFSLELETQSNVGSSDEKVELENVLYDSKTGLESSQTAYESEMKVEVDNILYGTANGIWLQYVLVSAGSDGRLVMFE